MLALPHTTVEHVSSIIDSMISSQYGLQYHGIAVSVNNTSYASYTITVSVLSYFNLCKYLSIKYIEDYGVYSFKFDIDIVFASRTSIIEQIAEGAKFKVIEPLLKALDEFNFDNEVNKLLTN